MYPFHGKLLFFLSDEVLQRKNISVKKRNTPFCVVYAKDKRTIYFLWGGKGYTKSVLEYLYDKYNTVVIDDVVYKEQYNNGVHIICDDMDYFLLFPYKLF